MHYVMNKVTNVLHTSIQQYKLNRSKTLAHKAILEMRFLFNTLRNVRFSFDSKRH